MNPRTLARASRIWLGSASAWRPGLFVMLWIGFIGQDMGFGTAIDDPKDFIIVMLNGITAAGLYFVVASGFTLIFGLMRVVNMAHGSFFLLGGYIALRVQRDLVGQGGAFGLSSSQVSVVNWVVPAIVGTRARRGSSAWRCSRSFCAGTRGRICVRPSSRSRSRSSSPIRCSRTSAVSPRASPGRAGSITSSTSGCAAVQYSEERLLILLLALVIGAALWLWLKRTRTGMVIRAGVDDRAMVSALGINIQRTFAIAFFVGSALAGLGGVVGGSFASLAPGVDSNWLLNSLVVVIIGGMGSLGGAAIGSLLLGLTTNLSAAYLPATYNYYSIVLTFVLLAIVLAVRPLRHLRATGVTRFANLDRMAGLVVLVVAVLAPAARQRPTGSARC